MVRKLMRLHWYSYKRPCAHWKWRNTNMCPSKGNLHIPCEDWTLFWVTSKAILKKDKDTLGRMRERINGTSKGGTRLFHPGESNVKIKAKSITQLISFQIYQLFEYLSQFRVDCTAMDLFRIIAEILNAISWIPAYTPERVKTQYDNIINTHGLEDLKKLSI